MAYAAGSLIGPATGLGIAFAATVRRSIVPIPRIRPRHLGLRALVRHAIPLTVSSSVLQLSVVTSRAVASLVGPGAISAVRYGELLVKVPIGAIGPAWGSAIYPTLVQTTQAPNPHSLGMTVARAMRFTIAAFTPIAFLSAATAPVIVSVAYGRGAVTEEQLELTARVVVCLAPMILVAMTNPVMTGALNARRRGTTLLASGLLNVFLNIVLAITLGLAIGAPGIALASSSSGGASVAFKVWRLSMDEDRFSARALGRYLSLACVSALPATVVVGLIAWSVGPIDQLVLGLALLGTSGITGIIAYAVFARLSGMVEVQELQRLVSGRLTILVRRSVPR
jgi:putative peptidoglycan lipid II flippase